MASRPRVFMIISGCRRDADPADFYTNLDHPMKVTLGVGDLLPERPDQLPIQQEFTTRRKVVTLSERALAEVLMEAAGGNQANARGPVQDQAAFSSARPSWRSHRSTATCGSTSWKVLATTR